MISKNIAYLFVIPLTIFYIHFTTSYMQYFDIGINNSTRFMDIYWFRTPVVVIAQAAALYFGNKFVGTTRWRLAFGLAVAFAAVCLVFLVFAMASPGIPREGGFLRFLGYYFLNLEPGRMPDGTW